jgi:hypothetical protein
VKPVAIVQDNHNFWQEVWQEAEPIVAHAIGVLLLETSLLLIGLLAWLLEHLFPKQEVYFSWIEKVDIWTALALLSMFGVYTLLRVGIRLVRGLLDEWLTPP